MTTIIHISDLHLRENWQEEQGVVLREFFADLKGQLQDRTDIYVAFTGDILQEGSKAHGYQYFNDAFGRRLNGLGISNDKLIVVPGNHDVDRNYTKEHFLTLKSVQERKTDETRFNTNVYGELNDLLKQKFLPFLEWQESISNWPLTEASFCGRGFDLTSDIGIYCLNTALYSFGGLTDENQNTVSDYKELPVETRRLQAWLDDSTHNFRILVMHHPTDWLTDWAAGVVNTLCYRHFDLVLSGHIHKKDSLYITDGVDSFVLCSAPQLFSRIHDTLGYSIISIGSDHRELHIDYRQWAHDRFVAGTSFAKNDTGTLRLQLGSGTALEPNAAESPARYAYILKQLEDNFQKSLKCYTSLPTVWVLPNVSNKSEFYSDDESAVISPANVLHAPFRDCFIIAPRQFGLSSLGHYLAFAGWQSTINQYAMYIDSSELQNHETAIREYVQRRVEQLGLEVEDVKAFILDQGSEVQNRKLNNIKKVFPDVPLTVLVSRDDSDMKFGTNEDRLLCKFEYLYLWSLERAQMREIVRKFIDAGYELEEDSALQRLIDDIANLNVHRTPLVCLTLLAVYASGIETSPVNRTDMFERFLFLIFFAYKKFPDYGRIPDMKDALAVVGAFCEHIIRRRHNTFRKDEFIALSNKFCQQMSIDVDCSQLFEVMHRENIIVKTGDSFFFRYVHWIYFFGAHRMHHDPEFCSFVLSDKYYMAFPEIIEFYSGVDRRREELLNILTSDLRGVNESFEQRTGVNAEFDPYSAARWTPNGDTVAQLRDHLNEEAERSSLPVSLKDQIADRTYDRSVPYDQRIRSFVEDSSLLECIQILRASARALRNSDYVEGEVKRQLLVEIMRAWIKELQVLFLLSPIIAQERFAVFDNIKFLLGPGFEELEGDELWHDIVGSIPGSVVSDHDKDISSPRIAPLFRAALEEGGSGPVEFLLTAVIVRNRPEKWNEAVRCFIKNSPKNSFYLLKVYQMLLGEYRYGFLVAKEKELVFELMGMVVAKHETGAKSPSKKLVERAKLSLREFFKDEDSHSSKD